MHFSPELSFVINCCRSCFSGAPPVSRLASEELDWARVVRLARFHRVQGLVWNAVSESSSARELGVLADDAAAIAAANLKAATQCGALLADFEGDGVPLLFLKGLTLGAIAYGSAALKAGVDVDLLVDPDDIPKAAELLDRRGYRLQVPRSSPATLRRWHRIRKESLWTEAGSGVHVDLHTRVADNSMLIPAIGLASPVRRVDIGNGVALPTLGPAETFAYLAVHGASSAWFRLKWISDFAALLADSSAAEIEELYHRSLQLGAGRAPAQALLLADRLFGTLANNSALKTELLGDRMNRLLCRAALKQLAGRGEPIEPTSRRLGTLRIHWMQFLLVPGLRFKGSELVRQARSALA